MASRQKENNILRNYHDYIQQILHDAGQRILSLFLFFDNFSNNKINNKTTEATKYGINNVQALSAKVGSIKRLIR